MADWFMVYDAGGILAKTEICKKKTEKSCHHKGCAMYDISFGNY